MFAYFGKNLIHQLNLVAEKMGLNENPVLIVVSPLVALMEDQVKQATEMGIMAMQLMSKPSGHQKMVTLCNATRTPHP